MFIKLTSQYLNMVDFIYFSQFQLQTNQTLANLHSCLDTFYCNKDITIRLKVHDNFNIPKNHSLIHYIESIHALGSPNGYNTKAPECPHINCAKQGHRASNKKDYIKHQQDSTSLGVLELETLRRLIALVR